MQKILASILFYGYSLQQRLEHGKCLTSKNCQYGNKDLQGNYLMKCSKWNYCTYDKSQFKEEEIEETNKEIASKLECHQHADCRMNEYCAVDNTCYLQNRRQYHNARCYTDYDCYQGDVIGIGVKLSQEADIDRQIKNIIKQQQEIRDKMNLQQNIITSGKNRESQNTIPPRRNRELLEETVDQTEQEKEQDKEQDKKDEENELEIDILEENEQDKVKDDEQPVTDSNQ